MTIEAYDLAAYVREKIASQYKEAEKLQGWIVALLSEIEGLEAANLQSLTDRWLDTAEGVQLDILGVIVGQTRTVVDASDLYYFGYQGAYHASAYGAARYALQGEVTGGVRILLDVEYREFIRARIARNHCRGTINDVIALTEFLVGGSPGSPPIYLQETTDAKMHITVGEDVDINRRLLLLESDLFPKPAGVQVSFAYVETPPFGYLGAPDVEGYGTGHYATTTA